jgi:hypothetical protein
MWYYILVEPTEFSFVGKLKLWMKKQNLNWIDHDTSLWCTQQSVTINHLATVPEVAVKYWGTIHKLQKNSMVFNGESKFIRQSSGSHQAIIRQSSGSHQTVIRQSSESRQTVFRQSLGSYKAVIRQSNHKPLIFFTLSQGKHKIKEPLPPFSFSTDVVVYEWSLKAFRWSTKFIATNVLHNLRTFKNRLEFPAPFCYAWDIFFLFLLLGWIIVQFLRSFS